MDMALLLVPATSSHDTFFYKIIHETFGRIRKKLYLAGTNLYPFQMSDFLHFVDTKVPILIHAKKLPHWHQESCVQFVTFRLSDALPQSTLVAYDRFKTEWLRAHPKPWDEPTSHYYKETFANRIDRWLHAGHGSCILQKPYIRAVVENTILKRNGEQYDLLAMVIMPNHVHVLMTPCGKYRVLQIVAEWKKWSARRINNIQGKRGALWQNECFDHMVRNHDEYKATLNYIIQNPANLPPDTYTLRVFYE